MFFFFFLFLGSLLANGDFGEDGLLVREIRETEGSGESPKLLRLDEDSDEVPCFAVFPQTNQFDQIHIKISRSPLEYMWKKIYLEDFFDMSGLRPQPAVSEIRLNLSMITDRSIPSAEFYKKAIGNLRTALPNLRTAILSGGFRFEAENATMGNFTDELGFIQMNIQNAVGAFGDFDIRFDEYSVDFELPEKIAEELRAGALRQLVVDVFRPTTIQNSDSEIRIRFAVGNLEPSLRLTVSSPFPRRTFTPRCLLKQTQQSGGVYRRDLTKKTKEEEDECIKEVFPSGQSQVAAMDDLYLEDFFDLSSTEPQTQLHRLNLSVSVANEPLLTHEQFYEQCVENLKRAAPNLEVVGLYGTFRYYPTISALHEFRTELLQIKRSIDAMSRSIRRRFRTVEWNEHPTFAFAIDKEILKRIQGGDIVRALDLFNYSSLEISKGKATIWFSAEEDPKDIRIDIILSAWHPESHSPF